MTDIKHEALEEALGNLLAVIHGDGGHRALEVGVEQAAAEAEKIVARLLSSAPEAREGEAVTVSAVCGWCDGAKVVQSQTYGHVICAHCRGSGVETYTRTVTAAPSADKLRIAVEALKGARDPLSTAKMWGKRKGGCDGAVDKIDRALWGIKQALAVLRAGGRDNEAGRLERIKDRASEALAALKGDAK